MDLISPLFPVFSSAIKGSKDSSCCSVLTIKTTGDVIQIKLKRVEILGKNNLKKHSFLKGDQCVSLLCFYIHVLFWGVLTHKEIGYDLTPAVRFNMFSGFISDLQARGDRNSQCLYVNVSFH